MNEAIVLPWYRQFWFWFVFGPLLFIIVLCVGLVIMAFYYADDVVTDNYYKDGVMINQLFDQDAKALSLGLSAAIKFNIATNELFVSIKTEKTLERELPEQLSLFMDNPVKKTKDRHLIVQEISPGEYYASLTFAPEFSWYLSLVPESDEKLRKKAEWLLSGEINFMQATETILQPRIK